MTDLLNDRQKTHGSFQRNAEASQKIKEVIQNSKNYLLMSAVRREALDMIALKISRILSGDHTHQDHWDDIVGYATLAADNSVNKVKTYCGIDMACSPDMVDAVKMTWGDYKDFKKLAMRGPVFRDGDKLKNVPTGSGFCNHSKHFNDCEICG